MANRRDNLSKGLYRTVPMECGIVTRNREMKALIRKARLVAPFADVIRIGGENGTGKELFANLIHEHGRYRGRKVTANVAGFDDHLFADTMFGHVKGAFSGAEKARQGLARKANGGTLFLDEIGDLSLPSQVKILRLIQNKEIIPLGADNVSKVELQLIVATNQPLRKMVINGRFRKDLYFRIDTHHLQLPPLRERLDDLPILAAYFADRTAAKCYRPTPGISRELLKLLCGYSFPGNVRELQNLIEEGFISGNGSLNIDAIRVKMEKHRVLAEDAAGSDTAMGRLLKKCVQLPSLKEADRCLFDEAYRRTGGNQTMAAKILGISQAAVSKRVKKME